MAKLMLVDGNSLTYRAFFALPQDLATASGQVTNAVFGFTSMLINLMRDHRPDGVAVAFDRPEPTFRHEQVDTYKANREKAPDILHQQLDLVRKVVEVLRIPEFSLAGYEGDDILATLATKAAAEGHEVLVVTGDRDSYQLVRDPLIKVLYNKRGVSDYALYDEAGIEERTGVRPELYVQYAALRGDSSDNLPGVPGVGEKTAAKLVNKYGGIEGIYEHVAEQTPKLRENLAAHEADVRVNVAVMELLHDVPIEFSIDDLVTPEPYDVDEVRSLFDFLEFRTLFNRLVEAFGDGEPQADRDVLSVDPVLIASTDAAVEALGSLTDATAVAVAAAADGSVAVAAAADGSVALSDGSGQFILPPDVVSDGEVEAALSELLGDPAAPRLVAHDAKPLLRRLASLGVVDVVLRLDTALAAYLIDPSRGDYSLADVVEHHGTIDLPELDLVPEGQLDFGESEDDFAGAAAVEAAAVATLVEPLESGIDEAGLRGLHDDVEVPLVGVLARMERLGVGVDRAELTALNRAMADEADVLSRQIQQDAGEDFNVNSTKALRVILFDKLGLTPGKKTKTGYSTDAATLEKLVGQHPIVEHLLRYREVEKLRSTYGESLLAATDDDDRIRATFNQMVARTGRLSSENPNLHNIPVRTEMGRSFRKAFVPVEGFEFLVADYNQIELRCIAHLSSDPGLVEAFATGADIHRTTAARVFGVEPEDVTYEQRSKAKMVSYGLAYGMEAYGLGQRLAIPTREAQDILDAYFEAFPAVRSYMDETVTQARSLGYTETLFGRRRPIPELLSDNWRVRQAGERQAMNAGIQGLAADIFKVALVRIDRRLQAERVHSRLVLQVHDEVILEVPPNEQDAAREMVVDEMAGAFALAVPLEVNLSFGSTWADAKD